MNLLFDGNSVNRCCVHSSLGTCIYVWGGVVFYRSSLFCVIPQCRLVCCWCFGTLYQSLLPGVKMSKISWPEKSVTFQPMLCNNPDEQRS